jgi:hypothetical protein
MKTPRFDKWCEDRLAGNATVMLIRGGVRALVEDLEATQPSAPYPEKSVVPPAAVLPEKSAMCPECHHPRHRRGQCGWHPVGSCDWSREVQCLCFYPDASAQQP